MNKLQSSRYNYTTEHNGKVYIYNTLHRSFISLQENLWNGFCNGESEVFTPSEIAALQDNGIILPDSVDERYIFRDIMQSSCIQHNEINLFLSMTSMCNLSCPYCYQDYRIANERKRFIDRDRIDNLCHYLQESQAKKISIVYFGGEPTLDTERLIYAIQKINSLEGKIIKNSLITNGYSISDSLLAEIKKHKSFSVQITLDGDRNLHDTLRITNAKTGTYDSIIKNIDAFVDIMPSKVCIRINVSSLNFEPYKRLIDVLFERYQNGIQVSFAAIFNGQKKINETDLKDIVDILDLIEYANNKGYDTTPSLEYAPCIAKMNNSFAVDENLNIYTCPACLYEKPVGTINENSQLVIYDNEWYKAIYERKSCVEECIYGGLCYGGCIMSKMECKKNLFDRLLPYVVNHKIKKQEMRYKND